MSNTFYNNALEVFKELRKIGTPVINNFSDFKVVLNQELITQVSAKEQSILCAILMLSRYSSLSITDDTYRENYLNNIAFSFHPVIDSHTITYKEPTSNIEYFIKGISYYRKAINKLTGLDLFDYLVVKVTRQSENNISLAFGVIFMSQRLQTKYGFNEDLAIPASCIISKKELYNIENQSDIYIKMRDGIRIQQGFYDTLSRKYEMTIDSNKLIYTNEITPKSKMYVIYDKAILRAIKTGTIPSLSLADNQVLLNPNLNYFLQSEQPKIPIKHLIDLLDIDEKKLLTNMKKTSYITAPIVSLGLGGLMSNFMYWTHQLQQYFNLPYVFKKLMVYDDDVIEFDNLFRIPLAWRNLRVNTAQTGSPLLNKIFKAKDYINHTSCHKVILMNSVASIAQEVKFGVEKFYPARSELRKHSIVIGGPDLQTRVDMFEVFMRSRRREDDIKFICPTHQNDELQISFFPNFNPELLVETYGKVNLNKFLLTMFKMTTELFDIVANEKYLNEHKDKLIAHKYLQWSINNVDFKANSAKSKALKDICYLIP